MEQMSFYIVKVKLDAGLCQIVADKRGLIRSEEKMLQINAAIQSDQTRLTRT